MKQQAVPLTSLFEKRAVTSLKALGLPVPPGTPPCEAQVIDGRQFPECCWRKTCARHGLQCEGWKRYEAGPDEFTPRHCMAGRPLERQALTALPRSPKDRGGDAVDQAIDRLFLKVRKPPLPFRRSTMGDRLEKDGVRDCRHWGFLPAGIDPDLEAEADAAAACGSSDPGSPQQ